MRLSLFNLQEGELACGCVSGCKRYVLICRHRCRDPKLRVLNCAGLSSEQASAGSTGGNPVIVKLHSTTRGLSLQES